METAAGWKLQLDYTVSNTGNGPAPWSWVAHPLFAVEPGDRIVLPSTIKEMRLEGSGAGRLGKKGDRLKWPIAMLADGGSTDLSMVQEPEAKIGDKLFAGPMSKHENWCALERRCAKLRIKLTFDVESTPYLGLWICYGGWPDAEGPKQMCVALEPSTAPVDSLAETGPWSRVLKPGESYSWPMTVEIEII
jgi:galactose mutarotase-like enzyme